MLLKNPDKMHRLKSEVRGAFKNFEDMTTTKLSQLEYLQACIDEGLRMYPPLPTGAQRVKPAGGAMVCGRWVPSGVNPYFNPSAMNRHADNSQQTLVQTTFFSLQRSPTNFKNPNTFTPERFLPEGAEEYASDRKDGLNPFSFGPKNCVGKK
jgi:cytochrome P450